MSDWLEYYEPPVTGHACIGYCNGSRCSSYNNDNVIKKSFKRQSEFKQPAPKKRSPQPPKKITLQPPKKRVLNQEVIKVSRRVPIIGAQQKRDSLTNLKKKKLIKVYDLVSTPTVLNTTMYIIYCEECKQRMVFFDESLVAYHIQLHFKTVKHQSPTIGGLIGISEHKLSIKQFLGLPDLKLSGLYCLIPPEGSRVDFAGEDDEEGVVEGKLVLNLTNGREFKIPGSKTIDDDFTSVFLTNKRESLYFMIILMWCCGSQIDDILNNHDIVRSINHSFKRGENEISYTVDGYTITMIPPDFSRSRKLSINITNNKNLLPSGLCKIKGGPPYYEFDYNVPEENNLIV